MRRLLASLFCLALWSAGVRGDRDDEIDEKAPWFCGKRDCPRFTTLKEVGSFAVRRYEPSVWAAVCIPNAHHEEAIWRGTAELMEYIKGANAKEKELWGGTPFAHHMALSEEHLVVWDVAARNESVPVECAHASVCVAYYLPEKYQSGKRPPRSDSEWVRIVRVPKWIAYVHEFDGFPTKFRMIEHYMHLVHMLQWHHLPYNRRVAMGLVYNAPWVSKDRHNEVLVPARRLDDLFGQDAEDLYADTKRMLPVKTTAVQPLEEEDLVMAALKTAEEKAARLAGARK